MKRLIILSACCLIAASSAVSAMSQATSVNIRDIQNYAPNTDVSSLTNVQIRSLLAIIHGGDKEGEIGRWVRAYLLNIK